MKRCAFLSMQNLGDFVCYDHLLSEPLARLGWHVQTIPWREKDIDWNRFDAVIIRSTWDYQNAPTQFLEVLSAIDQSSAHLENARDLVRWNLDKRYLAQMAQQDIPIVPTRWHEYIDDQATLSSLADFDADEVIIKPVVSANADHTYRLANRPTNQIPAAITKAFRHRPLMVQPFMDNIVTEGEFSLFYFDGDYSHAILKTPDDGDFRVQEEHGGRLKSIEPADKLQALGRRTVQALPQLPLYARVDFVQTDDTFLLMELELIEPSLYFNMDPASPQRFADAFDRRMNQLK